MLQCCRVFLDTESGHAPYGENTCVRYASFTHMSYGADGHEFNVNESTIYIK